ncbi:MAG TPA: hypothetical protein VEN78_06590 [Bradyrhizobium sp.]|nr:hypothetical protein [Bradyrhizobium sp.]
MKRSTRLGYAFAFAIVVGVPTPLVLAFISRNVADAFLEGNWFGLYWFALFVLAYLLAPMVSRHFKPRGSMNPERSMGYLARCAYAFAYAVVASAIALAVLPFISKGLASTFIDDGYWSGIFVIAFLFAPTVNRYLKSRGSRNPEQSMEYLVRFLYALAFAVVMSAIALIVLPSISKEWADTFIDYYCWAGIFVIAFVLAPTVSRYLKSHSRGGP